MQPFTLACFNNLGGNVVGPDILSDQNIFPSRIRNIFFIPEPGSRILQKKSEEK
jgi:hypothetical protein